VLFVANLATEYLMATKNTQRHRHKKHEKTRKKKEEKEVIK
jgi:hypothetical protein